MSQRASIKIVEISKELDSLRFTNLDQNLHGIRDRLFCLAADVRRLESRPKLDPEFFQSSDWECAGSPTGYCVYTQYDFDCCIFCGDPDERK